MTENNADVGAPRRTTQEERDRAAAVNSIGDETRVHAEADETEQVQGPGGELRRPHGEDLSDGVRDRADRVDETADESDGPARGGADESASG
ncbi:hypothetical protein [Phytoactinopolyspora halotolerans]|uniref:Uncharacterized protein n=1 Tax=Phytoactinopolyspora halotolerans TaxID=1981512 RepID=A0A6L9SFL5_9ACTN|nr:hypothetical protein [Phytoactinopolyspora halotolerans]NEE03252.1 hypothetical protein [Phytoactinopolyspora halotolerans]